MSKKIRIIAGVIIAAWLLIQVLYFSPFTAENAIRWSVLWHGFVGEAYTVRAEAVSPDEINEIGDLQANEFTAEQTVYRITEPELRNSVNGTEMQYWVVTHKNGLYHAKYTGY
ncbi:MAG: hypothetical protein MR966_02010 [Lachnospiraceae bacterium]|nr:hypothetical protein [Lachnospiraceae bacterium]